MKNLSIKRKISFCMAAMGLFLLAVVVHQYFVLNDISVQQDAGAESYTAAVSYARASAIGPELYQVIADAEINHQLDETETE